MMTAKEAAKLAGRSETWLRTHCCAWCDTNCLEAIRHGCGAIFQDKFACDPKTKDYSQKAQLSTSTLKEG